MIHYVNTLVFNADATALVYLKKITGPVFLRGKYNFIGGKIEPGETPTACVVREVMEEAAVALSEDSLTLIHSAQGLDNEGWSLATYGVRIDDWQWRQVHQAGIESIFTGNVKALCEDALAHNELYCNDFVFFIECARAHHLQMSTLSTSSNA